MWLVDLLQKTVPHLGASTDAQEAVDVARIREIRVRLLKHAKTRPGEIVRKSDDGLIDALCMLRLELDALPDAHALRSDAESRSAIEIIYAELDRLLGKDVSFEETQDIDGALERLSDAAGAHARRRQGQKRTIRRLSLLVTVVPLLGFGAHWTLGNFYRQALIEDVDIVYPQSKFEYVDDRYRLRETVEKASLQEFREYYFRDTTFALGMGRNPLPLAFHVESAADLGVELPDEIKERLEGGVMSLRAIDTNLFIFRVFVRNIRDSNIVNSLRVRAERLDDDAFPWQQMDVDTEILVESGSQQLGRPLVLTVHTTRTPVLKMNLGMRLKSAGGDVGQVVHEDLGTLVSTEWLTPDFGAQLLSAAPEQLVFVRLSPERAAAVALDRTHHRSLEQAERDFDSVDAYIAEMDAYITEHDYLFFACPDDGVALVARPHTLQQLLGLEAVEVIEIDYSYQRLDGVDRSGQRRLAPDQPTLRLQGGLGAQSEELQECVQDLPYYFGYDLGVMAAAGPGSWLGELDKIALMLADAPGPKAPVIAAEETLLLDFEGELQEIERGVSKIHILKDGEYVLFTIVVTNFRGGNHRFVFYFDEDPVAELTAALQWPESRQFTAGDEALFRPDSDASTGNR